MKESFWKKQPLYVTSNSFRKQNKLLLTVDQIASKCHDEITKNPIHFEYKLLTGDEDEIIEFINNNYHSDDDTHKLIYSQELFKFFNKGSESIHIMFYSNEKLIGFISGSLKKVSIRNSEGFDSYDTVDTDFLCVIPQYRGTTACSYMMSVSLLEWCSYFRLHNITEPISIYTVSYPINAPAFCEKSCYYRPLNISHLVDVKILENYYKSTVYKKVYSTFSYSPELIKNKQLLQINSKNITDEIVSVIYEKLKIFNENECDIYDHKSITEIHKMLTNPSFYCFVIQNIITQEITDFVCYYSLNNLHKSSEKLSKTGYLYSWFFNSTGTYEKTNTQLKNPLLERVKEKMPKQRNYIPDLLELINQWFYTNKIFDMVIFTNSLVEMPSKCLKTSQKLYYYVYNLETYKIKSSKNSLITI